MEKKSLILYGTLVAVLLFASTIAITVQPAHALVTISGNTKDGSGAFTVGYAKVSAEAAGHYYPTTSDAYGFWSLSVDSGVTFTVDGSKDLNGRGRLTGIVGPASNLVVKIPGSTTNTIEFFIVSDEEFRSNYGASWQTSAKNKLFTAQPYFAGQHNIHFKDQYYYTTWDSNDSALMCDRLTEAKTETGWSGGTHQGANVLWAVTAQYINGDTAGCANVPGASGSYPGSIVADFPYDFSENIMHELSHNYGTDHTFDTWYDIMNYVGYEATNWKPTGTVSSDDLVKSHRGWY